MRKNQRNPQKNNSMKEYTEPILVIDETIDLHRTSSWLIENKIEAFLDAAVVKHRKRVLIIHGIGRGVLRQITWNYLSTSPYKSRYYYATRSYGGYGATVVELL